MKRALAALLVVAAAASCLAYAGGASAFAAKRLVALATVVLVLATSLAGGATPRVGVNPAWLAGLAFMLWSAASALWGADGSVHGLGVLIGALGFGSVSASLGGEHARRVAALTGLAVGGVLAVLVIALWFAGSRGFSLHAGQGNPNWAGLVLAVASPLAVSAPLPARWPARARRAFRIGCGVVLVAAIAATASRTAMIATLAGFAVLALARAHGVARRVLGALLLAAAVAGALSFGMLATGRAETTRHDGIARALHGRLWIHGVSLRAAVEHAPWGAGLGRFHEAFLREQGRALLQRPPAAAARTFQNATTAHNDFLDVALEGGPLSFLLLAGTLGLAFRQHWRLGFAAGAGSVLAFATASLADSPLRETPAPILLSLVLAALPGTASEERPGRGARLVQLCVLATAGALLPNALLAFAASRARTAARDAPPAERLELLRRAAELEPTNAAIALELGSAHLELGDIRGAVADLQRAERLDRDPASAVALGNALLSAAELESARAAYERACALNPGSFRSRVGLAEGLRRLGRFSEAETHARAAIALLPGDARARELLDRIREQHAGATLGLEPSPSP